MRLVEFALQGVRRFEDGRKLAFHEGYNLVTGPNESGKTTCLLVLLAALEPERLEAGAAALLPASVAGAEATAARAPARCGLVFLHEDRTYRLVRDLAQGAANLAALDPASGKFVTEHRDADAIRRWLRETAEMPARRVFDTLFLIERAGMPSAAIRVTGAPAGATPTAGDGEAVFSAAAAAYVQAPPLTGAAREARIAELKAELARIEEMGKVEFRLDGVKAKLFELEAEFGDFKKLDALAAELDTALAEFEALGVDPDELEARARGFKTLADRRAADLAAVEAEREALEARAAAPVTAVMKDPLVTGGIAGAVLCLVAGLWVPLIAAGALAGLGAATFGVLRDSQAAARQREALAGLAALDERVQAIEKRFEIESKALRTAQEVLGVSGPEGVLERVDTYRTLRARRQSVRERREALGRQKDFGAIEAERARLVAEVSRLEEELRRFGASAAFDPGELRRELAALEGRAGPAPHHPAGTPLGTAGWAPGNGQTGPGEGLAAPGGPAVTAGAGGVLGVAFDAWLDAAASVLGEMRETVAREVLLKAQPLVAPLTADRHRSIALSAEGRLVVVDADGRVSPAASLSPATQDALYLVLRLAGFAVVARHRPWPLLLDDPLTALDDVRLAAACRALKATARAGQIVHFAARKLPPALADKAQALG